MTHLWTRATATATLLVFACAFVLCSQAQAPPVEEPETLITWLNISKMKAVVPQDADAVNYNDSFMIQGSFNIAKDSFVPADQDVTLTSGTWSKTFTKDMWRRLGSSGKYKAFFEHVSIQIDYWVGGSSRCNFSVVGTKQQLTGTTPDYPTIPVRLQVGTFDETSDVQMQEETTAPSMVRLGSGPVMAVDTVRVTRSPKDSRDTLTMTGRAYGTEGFDAAVDDMTIELGGFSIVIPAGSITQSADGKVFSYRGTLATEERVAFKVVRVGETGKFTLSVTQADLSSLAGTGRAQYQHGRLALELHWNYEVTFQENKTHTAFKY